MDYKETPVAGKQWQRCYAIDIQNPYNQTPTITMQEEVITEVGVQTFHKRIGPVTVAFDPEQVIELIDPLTGQALGASLTQGQIHVALWSLYMAKAAERDAQVSI